MSNQSEPEIRSVTELTSEIRFQLNNEFSGVWVSGEISGLARPSSGHLYFTLKDKTAQISGIVWRSTAARLKFDLENGLDVLCYGDVDVYPQRGSYQLIVRKIQPMGEGALQLAFRRLHEKLEAEGLFAAELKKPLPEFPRKVVVITSPSGAAVRDFLQVLERRWSNLEVLIIPVRVQGPGSADEIAAAIESVSQFADPPDVVVVTRGGGSIEDLWSFNEESVCRAIHACPIPVISGVGHEIDVTLADLAADVRALTPSEAAERLVPDKQQLLSTLGSYHQRMQQIVLARYQSASQQLESLATRPVLRRPLARLQDAAIELNRIENQMTQSLQQKVVVCEHQIKEATARMESLNPMSVLARGYSLTSNSNGELLSHCSQIEVGESISTQISDGTIVSRVESVEEAGEGNTVVFRQDACYD